MVPSCFHYHQNQVQVLGTAQLSSCSRENAALATSMLFLIQLCYGSIGASHLGFRFSLSLWKTLSVDVLPRHFYMSLVRIPTLSLSSSPSFLLWVTFNKNHAEWVEPVFYCFRCGWLLGTLTANNSIPLCSLPAFLPVHVFWTEISTIPNY